MWNSCEKKSNPEVETEGEYKSIYFLGHKGSIHIYCAVKNKIKDE